ncbi:hypothetical protein E2C01_060057 [Portunus trituberculatus]|uniref:Uncharacterized protein n=1 Tax=Portunus trituberculatus TaxID=210409 RepID=A0A5B7H7U5_PORTR|nr:hypothetical protein [Portunus trituberculatus]
MKQVICQRSSSPSALPSEGKRVVGNNARPSLRRSLDQYPAVIQRLAGRLRALH